MQTFELFLPLIAFFVLILATGWWATRLTRLSSPLAYYLGERNLSGFVLAMTLVATYGSVSSFVSGPGMAWKLGLGWVVFAAPQIIAGFFVLGILGKKVALVSRRVEALTLIDVVKARFAETRTGRILCALCAVLMIIFFGAMMVGQLIGGARIFAASAGIDYTGGLLLFGVVTVLYTSLGGFRAVALTDTVCAVLMIAGMFLLGGSLIDQAGGWDAMTAALSTVNADVKPGAFTSFDAGGALSLPLLLSAWVLVGFATVGLPQSSMRCMAYEKGADLRRAMIYSTVVCGALMIGVTTLGVFARVVLPDPSISSTDEIVPLLIVTKMHPVLAGATLLGPLAATMSTVSSLLIMAASALVKDLLGSDGRAAKWSEKTLTNRTRIVTAVIGVATLLLAITPFDIVVWINLFAFGGLEIVFTLAVGLALFWRRATPAGTLWGILAGLAYYIGALTWKWPTMGFHAVVPGLAVALVVFFVVSLATKNVSEKTLSAFFPD